MSKITGLHQNRQMRETVISLDLYNRLDHYVLGIDGMMINYYRRFLKYLSAQ